MFLYDQKLTDLIGIDKKVTFKNLINLIFAGSGEVELTFLSPLAHLYGSK
jgi:hypothetical protein